MSVLGIDSGVLSGLLRGKLLPVLFSPRAHVRDDSGARTSLFLHLPFALMPPTLDAAASIHNELAVFRLSER